MTDTSPPSSVSDSPTPNIETFVLGDYQTNCFIVSVPGHAECWIVDCGIEPRAMLDAVEARSLTPTALLLTHAHLDHMSGVDEAMARFGDIPLYLHREEEAWCADPLLNLSALSGRPTTCRNATDLLDGGERLSLAGTEWEVIHAPGHSPGSVVYLHRPSLQAIVGDTLFAGSIGRFDFPSSDAKALRHTILETMMGLDDDLVIHPGHGPSTTIGTERASNPYVNGGF